MTTIVTRRWVEAGGLRHGYEGPRPEPGSMITTLCELRLVVGRVRVYGDPECPFRDWLWRELDGIPTAPSTRRPCPDRAHAHGGTVQVHRPTVGRDRPARPDRHPARTTSTVDRSWHAMIAPNPAVERGGVVPYIASWSAEINLPATVIERPGGIGFADERQRRTMRRLLCQVCGQRADHTDEGVLWLLRDYRDDWAGWPERMANTDPPLCVPCARTAVRLCPALRNGYVAVRALDAPICGVRGKLYRATRTEPVIARADLVRYDDPALRWTVATQLLRELHHCTMVDLDGL